MPGCREGCHQLFLAGLFPSNCCFMVGRQESWRNVGGESWLHLGGDEGQAWDRLCFKGTAFQASLSL